MSPKRSSGVVSFFIAAALVAGAGVANAAEPTRRLYPEGGNGGGLERTLNQLSSLFLAVPGIPLIAVAAEAGFGEKGKRMSKAWQTASYVISGLGIATGGVLIAADPSNGKSLVAGAILLGLGAFDLGLTLYRNRAANRPAGDVALVPIGGVDARGNTFGGVGLTITGF